MVFLTPWYLADALQKDVFIVGMVMMAFALLTFFIGPLSGALSDRIGYRGLGIAGIAVSGAVVYNLAPFTTRGQAGPFIGVQLDIFSNGVHWSYLTGALFSLLSAIVVFCSKSD